MPGGFPLGLELCNGNDQGTVTASSVGTAVTGGINSAKGSYAQLVASTPSDACYVLVCLKETSNSTHQCAVDIAIGASGSEKVIISNLLVEGSTNGLQGTNSVFPISIPAGTRIAARAQNGSTTADGPNVSVILFDGAFTQMEGAAGADDIGFVSATTFGTLLTASATVNVKGAYAQLTAATARDYMGFVIRPCNPSSGTAAIRALLDIAIGASGSELAIVPNAPITFSNNYNFFTGPFWLPIPAGTRIAARIQADAASATGGLVLHGIYK